MNGRRFDAIVRRLMRCPAAPFHEHRVRSEVEDICRAEGIDCRRDRFGNLLISVRRGRTNRSIVLVAHLDHPGFDIVKSLGSRRYHARFLGGVPDEYFRPGIKLRLLPGGGPARLGSPIGRAADKEHEIIASREVRESPEFAVWELEDHTVRSNRIHGRACDDLIGVAAILSTLIELRRSRIACHVIGAITRAEEVGFGGALALAAPAALPKTAMVISLETSREIAPVKMGSGVIIRVGDRSTVFDSEATRYLAEVANDLAAGRRGFAFQRALMSGGSCEGTVFSDAGWQTAAVCVALGNYHNCGPARRIAAEFVSRNDALGMVRLLVSAASRMAEFKSLTGRLRRRLRRLSRESGGRLRKTA